MDVHHAFYDSLPPARLETILLYFLGRFTVEKDIEDRTSPEGIEDVCYLLQEPFRRVHVELVFERPPPDTYSRTIRAALAELIEQGVEFHGFGGLDFQVSRARNHVLTLRRELPREQLLAFDLLFPSFAVCLRKHSTSLTSTFD